MELANMIPKEKTTLEKILSSYKVRQVSLWALDMCGILISILSSLLIILKGQSIDINTVILPTIIYMLIHTITFKLFKCYSSLWRYAGEEELISILSACLVYVIPVQAFGDMQEKKS